MDGQRRRRPTPVPAASLAAALALVALIAGAPPARAPAAPVAQSLSEAGRPRVVPLAAHPVGAITLPAADFVPNPVVWLVGVESFAAGSQPGQGPDVTLGTGFVVQAGPHGAWIATARHVVTGDGAAVYLVGGSVPHLADQLIRDPNADVALLHVPSLRGVSAAHLSSSIPADGWAAEVSCVRWPGWTYQSYPVKLGQGSFTTVPGVGHVLLTPTLSVLPGCSGGPVVVYGSGAGEAPTVVGVAVDGVTQPSAVEYVPAAAVTGLLR